MWPHPLMNIQQRTKGGLFWERVPLNLPGYHEPVEFWLLKRQGPPPSVGAGRAPKTGNKKIGSSLQPRHSERGEILISKSTCDFFSMVLKFISDLMSLNNIRVPFKEAILFFFLKTNSLRDIHKTQGCFYKLDSLLGRLVFKSWLSPGTSKQQTNKQQILQTLVTQLWRRALHKIIREWCNVVVTQVLNCMTVALSTLRPQSRGRLKQERLGGPMGRWCLGGWCLGQGG